eukprot:TRINITY_DN387_c0_g1_i1.p1 TRINITY_DN387_c0_g1~~TRINITY_DN387_c0_g1_i1.p1  ORF type:complete len:901 (+),score=214.91 TRINITY_DN387_c0_g1_i1:111-2813(+)
MSSSQLFEPFRALGFITNEVPFAVESHGTNHFVATSVGKTFHIYNMSKLHLVVVGPPHEYRIRCLAISGRFTFTATRNFVHVHKGNVLLRSLECSSDSAVVSIVPLGDYIVVSCEDGTVSSWTFKRLSSEMVTKMSVKGKLKSDEKITCMMHPHTYLNKCLVGTSRGRVFLINIRTKKVVHEFLSIQSENEVYGITCIQQSPALDVVCFGTTSGRMMLVNLRLDRCLFSLVQERSVTSIAFRNDGTETLSSGSESGEVALWDLNDRKLLFTMSSSAHSRSVSGVFFLPNEPVLLTGGADNALKMFIFDRSDGRCRLLRERSGHATGVRGIRWHDEDSLLSFAEGSHVPQLTSLRNDARGGSFSSPEISLKDIVQLSSGTMRSRDWEDLLTIHHRSRVATLWSVENRRSKEKALKLPRSHSSNDYWTCGCVSACGNFAILGTHEGYVFKFNMQSGKRREFFRARDVLSHGGRLSSDNHISSIVADSTNSTIFVAAMDGIVSRHSFSSLEPLEGKDTVEDVMNVASPISVMRMPTSGGFLAVASDDHMVHVFDTKTCRIVRMVDVMRRVTDMTFSPDRRLLVIGTSESSVITLDLVCGSPIDAFQLSRPITTLDFHPSAKFLVIGLADSPGLYLWTNMLIFGHVLPKSIDLSHIVGQKLPSTAIVVDTTKLKEDDFEDEDVDKPVRDGVSGDDEGGIDFSLTNVTEVEKETCFAELDGSARPKWATLPRLEEIRDRNQSSIVRIDEKKEVPFFLIAQETDGEAIGSDLLKKESRHVNLSRFDVDSEFSKAVKKLDIKRACAEAHVMSASSLDLEIRLIPQQLLQAWVKFFCEVLRRKVSFELMHGLLGLFLRVHGDDLRQTEYCRTEDLEELLQVVERGWDGLDTLFHMTLCVSKHAGHVQS